MFSSVCHCLLSSSANRQETLLLRKQWHTSWNHATSFGYYDDGP